METETEVEIKPSGGSREIKMIGGKEHWTTGKAAEYLGIAKITLLTLSKQARITNLHIGPNFYYQPEWLKEFLNEQTTIGIASRKGGKK